MQCSKKKSVHLEEDKVDDGVSLGEEVSQDSGGVSTPDLDSRQPEVNTPEKIPHLHRQVRGEFPKQK